MSPRSFVDNYYSKPPPNESFIYHRRTPPHSFAGVWTAHSVPDGDARTLTKTKNEQNQIIEIEIEIDRTRTPASHSNQRNRDGGAGGSTLGITIPFLQAVLLRRRRHPPPLILLTMQAKRGREGKRRRRWGPYEIWVICVCAMVRKRRRTSERASQVIRRNRSFVFQVVR